MDFDSFKRIFESKIYEGTRSGLVLSIADRPERFVGVFRSTPVKEKVAQFVSQSREIKFGDAFEELIGKLLEENDFLALPKTLVNSQGQSFNADQLVQRKDGGILLIEQKIRDDHDTSKRVGQIDNFREKILALISANGDDFMVGYFYFIDPGFRKNQAYYSRRLVELEKELGVPLKLAYGRELFEFIGIPEVWDEVIDHLTTWRDSLPTFSTLNFDDDSDLTLSEFGSVVTSSVLLKLFRNDEVRTKVLPILFPTNETLLKLKQKYSTGTLSRDRELCEAIDEFISKR